MIDIIKDTAVLSTIPEKTLRKVVDKSIYCINEAVVEAMLAEESVVELDLDIGILKIQLGDESIKYKFIPKSKLEESVKSAYFNKQNLLEDALDVSLVNKLTNIYKDIL